MIQSHMFQKSKPRDGVKQLFSASGGGRDVRLHKVLSLKLLLIKWQSNSKQYNGNRLLITQRFILESVVKCGEAGCRDFKLCHIISMYIILLDLSI